MSSRNASRGIGRGFQQLCLSCNPCPRVAGKSIFEHEAMLPQQIFLRVSQSGKWPAFADPEYGAMETLSPSNPPQAQGGQAR